MSNYNYSSFGPYMDPNVFRSTSHPVYHVDTGLVSPCYVATDALRSLRHGDDFIEPLPGRDFTGPQFGQGYRSDRRNIDQHSTRGVDHLVRKYDICQTSGLRSRTDKSRTNQNVAVTNSSIERVTESTLIHPKICMDGQYPFDFSTPVALSKLMAFPESQLDRLLESYDVISPGQHSYGARDREFGLTSSRESRIYKLALLLDFLGARQIAEVLRSGSGSDRSTSRRSVTAGFR